MPTKVLRCMRSKLCAITAFAPLTDEFLSRPHRVTEPVPYSMTDHDHERRAFALILHGGVVDAHPLGSAGGSGCR